MTPSGFEEYEDSLKVMKKIFSTKLGVAQERTSYMGKDSKGDWLFVVE